MKGLAGVLRACMMAGDARPISHDPQKILCSLSPQTMVSENQVYGMLWERTLPDGGVTSQLISADPRVAA